MCMCVFVCVCDKMITYPFNKYIKYTLNMRGHTKKLSGKFLKRTFIMPQSQHQGYVHFSQRINFPN